MSDNRSIDWFNQAKEEISFAEIALSNNKFSLCCFLCQQSAEKFLKSIAINRNLDIVRSHSIVKIALALNINGEALEAGKQLDQYYISTRYPDALPSGAPFEFFTLTQAREALRLLNLFKEIAKKELAING